MKLIRPQLLIFLIFVLLVTGWYFSSLGVFFAQDDFWFLKVSRVEWSKLWTLFIPASGAVWYRPLSSQVFFFFGQKLFGINPLPLHAIVMLTHALTIFSLYQLLRYLKFSIWVSVTTAIFYGLHQIHTVSISWLATYPFILGSLWLTLSLYLTVKRQHGWAFICTVLGMLTHEILLLTPLVWIKLLFEHTNKRRRLIWQAVIAYGLVIGVILWFRFVRYPTTIATHLYQISLSTNTFTTIKFYTLRFLGVPLGFDQLPYQVKIILVTLIAVWVLMIGWGIRQQLRSKIHEKSILALFTTISILLWVPYLLLSEHVAPYYLSFALVVSAPLVAWGLEGARKIHPAGYLVGVTAFVLLQFIGSRWTYQTHWIFQRAKLAESLANEGRFDHPVGSEEYFALGAGMAKDVFTR